MITTLPSPYNLLTDTWVQATWEEFVVLCDRLDTLAENRPELEQAQCYYDSGWMRIETMGTGSGHGQETRCCPRLLVCSA